MDAPFKANFLVALRLVLLLAALCLGACGGGGGGGDTASPATSGNTTVSPTADLPGTIYYASWGTSLTAYDPITQQEKTMVSNAKDDYAFVSQDGQWFGWVTGALGEIIEVKNVWDDSQSYTIKMGTDFHRVKGAPMFSPNGQNVLVKSDGDNSSDRELLSVRNQHGKVLEIPYQNIKDITGAFFDDWGWLNDNAILIASGAYLFVIRDIHNPNLEIFQQYGSYQDTPYHFSPSPDGTKLVYMIGRDIYVYDLKTGNQTQLTYESTARAPSWSPDGKYIAFVSGGRVRGCDPAIGIYTTLHVMPTNLPEPVRVAYGEQPSSDQVRTLQWHSVRGLENVCVFNNQTFWTPKLKY